MQTRRAALSAFVVGLPAAVVAQPPEELQSNQQVEQELMRFRAIMKEAIVEKDAAKLRSMYTDTYTHTYTPGKVVKRDARIATLLAGDPVVEVAPTTEVSMQVYGDVAILSGRSPVLNLAESRTHEFRWVQIFFRNGGAWKLAASQATQLPAST